MVSAATIVFSVSLALIIFLFAVKSVEARREARLAERARSRIDAQALRLKGALASAESRVELTPWFLGALARWGVHVGALSFARLAKKSAEYAHAIADFVSHKRSFERRETRSQYLKIVANREESAPAPTPARFEAPHYEPEPAAFEPEPYRAEPLPEPAFEPEPEPVIEPEPVYKPEPIAHHAPARHAPRSASRQKPKQQKPQQRRGRKKKVAAL